MDMILMRAFLLLFVLAELCIFYFLPNPSFSWVNRWVTNLVISDFSGLYGEVGFFSFFLYEISRIFSLRHLRGLGWTLTKKRTARVFFFI